jgi:hypothetical protein
LGDQEVSDPPLKGGYWGIRRSRTPPLKGVSGDQEVSDPPLKGGLGGSGEGEESKGENLSGYVQGVIAFSGCIVHTLDRRLWLGRVAYVCSSFNRTRILSMGLKDLASATMISIGNGLTTASTDPTVGKAAAILARDPLLSSYVLHIITATNALIHLEAKVGKIAGKVGELTRLLLSEDAEGDGLIAGFDEVVAGAAAICGDEALQAALLTARVAALGGEGRGRLVNASFFALSGEAVQMKQRLQPEHWQALDRVRAGDVTASDALRRWMSIADNISQMEVQRSQLRVQADDTEVSRAEALNARYQWIRVINAFLSTVEISTLSDADRAFILAPLLEAERKATESRKKQPTPETPASPAAAPPSSPASSIP